MALPQRYVEKDFYTEDEYLRWEEDAPYKSEYVRGEIRAMSGGTDYHNAICMNIGSALVVALRGRGCLVMSPDMKVRTMDGVMRYPDVTVVCGPRQFHGRGRSVITNPLLVVEVLSDSTEGTDRGEKFLEYQAIPSLTDYLLVSQRTALVEHYARGQSDHWNYQAVRGLNSKLIIPSLSVTLTLADIYDQIDFGEADRD
ncbi:MAG: Uma2 family endonuclease [Armatimonadetes bacterium]|nr:Uma2 family endonuclease [Armatimonadota bacterium]